jgi:hypothetical protein
MELSLSKLFKEVLNTEIRDKRRFGASYIFCLFGRQLLNESLSAKDDVKGPTSILCVH